MRCETRSIESFLSDQQIYNGGSQIYSQCGLHLSEGPNYYLCEMGEEKLIDEAQGLSIRFAAGVETRILSARADWR